MKQIAEIVTEGQQIQTETVLTQLSPSPYAKSNSYFAAKYKLMIDDSKSHEQKAAAVKSAQTIASLVQKGLNPEGGVIQSNLDSIVIFEALCPLVPLTGQVNGAEDLVVTYMKLICGQPKIPTEADLDDLALDICSP